MKMDEWFVLKSSSSVRSTVESIGLNQFCNHKLIPSQEPQPDRTWMNQKFFFSEPRTGGQTARLPAAGQIFLGSKIVVIKKQNYCCAAVRG